MSTILFVFYSFPLIFLPLFPFPCFLLDYLNFFLEFQFNICCEFYYISLYSILIVALGLTIFIYLTSHSLLLANENFTIFSEMY